MLESAGDWCCKIACTPRGWPPKRRSIRCIYDVEKGRKYVPEFPAITHVALTVTSFERSVPWYKALFGSAPILEEDTGPFQRAAWLTGGTVVGLTQFPDLNSTEPFNERRSGLDHLAFGCANRDELKAWEVRLNELGIPNGGIVDASDYSALSFRDPDNIALEFFAPRG
jgi:glyoxylase I family protein